MQIEATDMVGNFHFLWFIHDPIILGNVYGRLLPNPLAIMHDYAEQMYTTIFFDWVYTAPSHGSPLDYSHISPPWNYVEGMNPIYHHSTPSTEWLQVPDYYYRFSLTGLQDPRLTISNHFEALENGSTSQSSVDRRLHIPINVKLASYLDHWPDPAIVFRSINKIET